MVSSQYYWPGLTNDVKIYVSKAVPTIVDVLWPSFIALHLYRLHLVIPAVGTGNPVLISNLIQLSRLFVDEFTSLV